MRNNDNNSFLGRITVPVPLVVVLASKVQSRNGWPAICTSEEVLQSLVMSEV